MITIKQLMLILIGALVSAWAVAQQPKTVQVTQGDVASRAVYEGHIEAVTATSIAAQVSGEVQNIWVSAGEQVSAGQKLLQIDATQAKQQQAAMLAQVDALRAELHVLSQELQRQQQLFAKGYISQAALERVQAQQQAARAQLKAQQAQAQAAQATTEFFIIRAPYSGVISDVPAMQGDMAMPGMPLLSLFNPQALRVSVAVPAAQAGLIEKNKAALQVLHEQRVVPMQAIQVLPTADRSTHTRLLRITVGNAQNDLFPGQHVKVHLQQPAGAGQVPRLFVPQTAVIKRAELTAVYVLSAQGKPLLRQVRLGVAEQDRVEVRSGLSLGEHVFIDQHALSKE